MKRLIFCSLFLLVAAAALASAQPTNAELQKFNALCNDGAYEEAVDSGKVNFEKIMLFFKGKDDETFHLFMWKMFEKTARQQEGMVFFLNKFEEFLQNRRFPIHAYFWLDVNFKMKNYVEARRVIDSMAAKKIRGLNLEYARYFAATGQIDSSVARLHKFLQKPNGLTRSAIAFIPEFRELLTTDGKQKHPELFSLFEEPNNVSLPNEFPKAKISDKEFAPFRSLLAQMSSIKSEDEVDSLQSTIMEQIYADEQITQKALQNVLEMMETATPGSFMKFQLAALVLSRNRDSAIAARIAKAIINDDIRKNPKLLATLAFLISETNCESGCRLLERIYADMKPETVTQKLCSPQFSAFSKRIFTMLQAQSQPSIQKILENAPAQSVDSLLSVLQEVYEPSILPFLKKKAEGARSFVDELRYLRLISEIPSYAALKIINSMQSLAETKPEKDSIEAIKQHFIVMTKKLLSMEETVHRESKVNMLWENPEKAKDDAFRALIIENANKNIATANCIPSLDIRESDYPAIRKVCAKLIYDYSEDSFTILMKLKIQMLIHSLKSE